MTKYVSEKVTSYFMLGDDKPTLWVMRSTSKKMTTFENLSSSQKIRAALHRDIQSVCAETCHFLGLEITKPAMEIIAELVYKKLSVYGTDLEAFAKHAKRTSINSDDVKLLVRRNSSLKSHLNSISPSSETKRRKTIAAPINQADTATKLSSKHKEESPKDKEFEREAGKRTNDRVDNISNDTIDLTFD